MSGFLFGVNNPVDEKLIVICNGIIRHKGVLIVRSLKMLARASAVLMALSLLSSCATSSGLSKVVLERTASSRGASAAYVLSIESNGVVRYKGMSNVKVVGEEVGTVSAADWKILDKAFEGADFFSLEERYGGRNSSCTSSWNHHPTINVTAVRGEVSKRVSYYTGCWGLREGEIISWLAKTADMVAGSVKWVHETIEDELNKGAVGH